MCHHHLGAFQVRIALPPPVGPGSHNSTIWTDSNHLLLGTRPAHPPFRPSSTVSLSDALNESCLAGSNSLPITMQQDAAAPPCCSSSQHPLAGYTTSWQQRHSDDQGYTRNIGMAGHREPCEARIRCCGRIQISAPVLQHVLCGQASKRQPLKLSQLCISGFGCSPGPAPADCRRADAARRRLPD